MAQQLLVLTGRGGQGVKVAGNILANAAIRDGKNVLAYAVYGGLIRGGSVSQSLVIGDGGEELGSPEEAVDILFALHTDWVFNYGRRLKPGGLAVLNSEQVTKDELPRQDVRAIEVNLGELALKLGSRKAENMVATGLIAGLCSIASLQSLRETVPQELRHISKEALELNLKGLEYGYSVGLELRNSQGLAGGAKAATTS